MTAQNTPQLDALRALTDLVDTARERGQFAKETGNVRAAFALLSIARDLDGARTCLVQEGDGYLDAAWAFIDTGRRLVVQWASSMQPRVASA